MVPSVVRGVKAFLKDQSESSWAMPAEVQGIVLSINCIAIGVNTAGCKNASLWG